MKKLHITLPAFLLTAALVLSGCVGQTKTPPFADKDTVSGSFSDSNSENSDDDIFGLNYTEEMLKDYFIYDGVLCTNCYACSIEWVTDNDAGGYNFDFSKVGDLVATIERMADLQKFENNTANVLPVGTEIYEFPDRWELLIAKSGNNYIPYMKMLEG
ncbi:MAG: hypothetical protein J1F03_01000 [Oscillospiraceae bacterium]|nr:hypothetical protein [Oscillospiraceae bacterium]